jgi:hypothetical protein
MPIQAEIGGTAMTAHRGPDDLERAGRPAVALLLALLLACAGSALAPARDAPEETSLRPLVSGCPVCDLWLEHENVILQASQEVGSLENGVIYFIHAQSPSVIEPLIRFAYQREELEETLRRDPALRSRLGDGCRHRLLGDDSARLEISTGAHGFFAILTSRNRAVVSRLQEEASQAARGRIVRF